MPEGGKYKKLPRPESIEAFKKFVSTKPTVQKVEQLGPQLFKIHRVGKDDITVHLTNIYIVSEADVQEILADNPQIDCIVTISAWNSYTKDAKNLAKENKIGLFKFKEFLGAVYYDGNKFLDYETPGRDEESNKKYPWS